MNGSGYTSGFIHQGKPETYFPDWCSTSVKVVPSGLASITPAGFAVGEQQVIHPAVRLVQGELPDGDPRTRAQFRMSWLWTTQPAATSCLSISIRALASRAR
jgi:hypothetical protein